MRPDKKLKDHESQPRARAAAGERGFSLLELILTVVVVAIVVSFAVIRVDYARASMRLQQSTRQFAGYMEKARMDAIRRHSTTSVTFTSPTTYRVTMDFDGRGSVASRTFRFEEGVQIISTGLPSVSFDWRGRTSSCIVTFALQNSRGDQSWIDVSPAGDVTVDSAADVLPSVSYANVNTAADTASGTIVTGTAVHNNSTGCNESGGSATPAPPIEGTGAGGCKITASVSSLTIKKNGGSTGTVTITLTNTGTVSPSTTSNIQVSPTSRSLTSGGSAAFTIKSLNNTRGTFPVTFNSPCSSVTVAVKVTN